MKAANPTKMSTTNAVAGYLRIVCFYCLIGVLAFILNSAINSGIRKLTTSSFGVWNSVVDGKINADILISGSSRAMSHYDSRILQKETGKSVYNIGLNGSQTDMQLARFKTYLAHNKKPSLLIFNLDLFSFQISHDGVYDPGQYLPYLQEREIYDALARINPDIWKARYIPLYGYAVEDLRFGWITGIMGLFGWTAEEDHFQGYKPKDSAWTEDFERFKKANPQGVKFELEPEGISQMEQLLQLCRDQGIPVLLIYSPEYKEMQAITNNRPKVFARFDDLSRKYKVPLWDYSASPISAIKENFYNSQHLNTKGATQFSQDLAGKIASNMESYQSVSPMILIRNR